jgi:spore germination protein
MTGPVRTRRARALWAAPLAVLVLVVGTVAMRSATAPDEQDLVAAAWLPSSDERGAASLRTALEDGALGEVSPTWATVQPDGGLVLREPAADVQVLLDASDVRVLPTVQNFLDGGWQGEQVAGMLSDPESARHHRETLVTTALDRGWDGVDIDYESLPPTAGPAFVAFLSALRQDLHEHDLSLSVAVPARTGDEDPGTFAYSYQALAEAVDQVRVMAYDHSWSGSDAGPVAPLSWVRDVLAYAVDRVPQDKLMLGVATYGYDWVGTSGTYLQATDARALADRVGADPEWDAAAAAHSFSYQDDDGNDHTVWYEDARSLAAKQQVAVDEGLRGVAIWALGGEDPRLWTSVAAAAQGSSGS